MRPPVRLALVLTSLAVLAAAAPPGARAAAVPFSGSLTVAIGPYPALAVAGSGVATVNGSNGGSHVTTLSVPSDAFAVAGMQVVLTDPATLPVMGVQLTVQNGAGAFSDVPLGGVMPLHGAARLCLFNTCANEPVQNLSIPLSVVGVGGAKTFTGVLNYTVAGNPWTTGVASVGTASVAGYAHGPASGTSSTAAASGSVRLVTPILLSTNINGFLLVPSFATLDLHFVPEPTTLMLLGSGVAGLVAMGRRARP
jgi:hypothetical protein